MGRRGGQAGRTRALARPRAPGGAGLRTTWPVWTLTASVLVAAGGLWALVAPQGVEHAAPLHLPWLALLPLVVAAQAGTLHLQVRRQAQTVTLCHLPVVLGLVCCTPLGLVAARVLGGALGMAALRGQRGLKLALNTAAYTLEAVTAVSLLHLLRDWPLPAALYAVVLVADLTSFVVVAGAISLFERRVQAALWVRPLVWLVPVDLVATSVALLALATLWQGLGYLPLLVGVLTCLLLAYRSYSRLRDRHVGLATLQDLASSLPALVPEDPELCGAVERLRVVVVAERVELWLPDGTVVLATEAASPVREVVSGEPPAPVPGTRVRGRSGRSILSAPVTYDGAAGRAVLVARDRLGEVRLFDRDDDRMLAALGALLAGALGRGLDRRRALEAASRDPLTGLWTLPEATRRAEGLLAAGDVFDVVILDVIGLQDVNDSLGHDAGDRVLQLAAERLRAAAGREAVTARIGGDELLAVLRGDGPTPAAVVEAVEGACELGGPQVDLRLRWGCAAGADGATFQQLVRHAQAALARAAATGTRSCLWTPALRVDPTRRLRLARDLQPALRRGEVTAVFQPLCRAADRVVVGAEALARWHHPSLGQVPPDEVVALAEQTGLVTELTRVVLDAALEQCRRWRSQGSELRVSVNLSPRSLAHEGLVDTVVAALARHGLPASALLLEITENSLMEDLDQGLQVLARLRGLGVETALDDFGTGHSSLGNLRLIPVSEVKLDRSLLADITTDPTSVTVVRAAVTLCHALGKLVVAEGVEDADAERLLLACGVDVLQGYHLGRPLPAQAWDDRLLAVRPGPAPGVPHQAGGAYGRAAAATADLL